MINSNDTKPIVVFCIPHAGSSSMVYRDWQNYFGEGFKIIPLELAGRGRRFKEKHYESILECAEDLYPKIESVIMEQKYVIFGHSMGALIAFELLRTIIKKGKPLPMHVVFSSRKSPDLPEEERRYLWDDQKLKDEIQKNSMEISPESDYEDLISIFLPIIRNDLKNVETYEYVPFEKIKVPITIASGKDDFIKIKELIKWEKFTYDKCTIALFDGGHFYYKRNMNQVCQFFKMQILDTINERGIHDEI